MNAKIDSEIVTLLAIGYFLIALPALIGGLVILAIPIPAVISSGARGTGLFFSMFGLGLAVLATGGVGTLSLIAGWGLLARKDWARITALVLGVVMLPVFPIGTILGAVSIWCLLQDKVRQEFGTAA